MTIASPGGTTCTEATDFLSKISLIIMASYIGCENFGWGRGGGRISRRDTGICLRVVHARALWVRVHREVTENEPNTATIYDQSIYEARRWAIGRGFVHYCGARYGTWCRA